MKKLIAPFHLYKLLSRIRPIASSYSLKFLFIAFLGIHIPLIGAIFYLLFGPPQLKPLPVFFLLLALTLVATAVTLYLLNGLLSPLHRSKNALEDYLEHRILPSLPEQFTDEAGVLMQKVQRTIGELDNMLREKQDLASLLSHDLKQPLAIIGTSAEVLQTVQDPEVVHRFARNISQLVKEQIHLLEDVLQLLQYDGLFGSPGQQTIVPVERLVADIARSVQAQAQLKKVEVRQEFAFDGLLSVHLELFRQVLKNLLHNAIKFSWENGIIRLRVERLNDKVLFIIQDQGMGFDPALTDRLFDRFTKAGQAGTANESSTGIGLHICQKMVQLHGGHITAFSDGPGKGAIFTVMLPLQEEAVWNRVAISA